MLHEGRPEGLGPKAFPEQHGSHGWLCRGNPAAATLIAAIQVMQLVRDRDGAANRPVTDTFDAADQPLLNTLSKTPEGKTARQKNPHHEGRLAHASWVMARLGGWTGYYAKPGPVVMLRGMLRFASIKDGWMLARDV